MDVTRFRELSQLIYSQQATEAQRDEWLVMIDSGLYEDAFQEWADKQFLFDTGSEPIFTAKQKHEQFRRIVAEGRLGNVSKLRRKSYRFAAAASLAFALLASIFWIWRSTMGTVTHDPVVEELAILPGTNKATLLLADGSVIALSTEKQGVILGDRLVYEDGSPIADLRYAEGGRDQPLKPNKIVVPVGGQYAITLSDGTRVVLNAASTLIYPSSFEEGKPRMVELVGEAFFDVQSQSTLQDGDAQEFWVITNDHRIQVLGTQFNVQSYANEPAIRTTLISGSVQVAAGGQILKLSPGEQSVSTENGLEKRFVDVDTYVAWRNGMFAFDGDDIYAVMNKLKRWYDVDVEFQEALTEDTFGGTISRFENIQEVLALLERTGKVRFEVEGRRVMVMN